jgi:glycosyltransferase involved in cell wall biosynthesis
LAGTEVYAAEVAARLLARGDEVEVFCAEKAVGEVDRRVRVREWEGVRVHEFVNNLHLGGLEETWSLVEAERAFGEVLDEVQPDVVHVNHLMYLSLGCLGEARQRGLGVVFTLHDLWLSCPRWGQRLGWDGELCREVDLGRCGECMAHTKFAATPMEERISGWLVRLKEATGLDLAEAARQARRVVVERGGGGGDVEVGEVSQRSLRELKVAVAKRDAGVREQVLGGVDRFLSPSRFVAQEMVRWGLEESRVEHLGTGLAGGAVPGRVAREGKVRVRFLGSLIPSKGAHVLVEAWGRLSEEARAAGELVLFGPRGHDAAYTAALERAVAKVGGRWGGALERGEVPQELARTDLVCLPSLWFENLPLVVLEARAAGVPLLVSDLGGLAEAVPDGGGGWRFAAGDAGELAAKLEELLLAPESLDAVEVPSAPLAEPHFERLFEVYAEVIRDRGRVV